MKHVSKILTLAALALFSVLMLSLSTGCSTTGQTSVSDVLDDETTRYVVAPLITQGVRKFVGEDLDGRGRRIFDTAHDIFDQVAADEYATLAELQTAIHQAVAAAELDPEDEIEAQAIVALVGRALRIATDDRGLALTETMQYIWVLDAIVAGANPAFATPYASPGPLEYYDAAERAEIIAEGTAYGMGDTESTLLAKFAAFFLLHWLFGPDDDPEPTARSVPLQQTLTPDPHA